MSGTDSATFSGFGSYVIDSVGWTLAGSNQLSKGQSLTDNGILTVTGSLGVSAGAIVLVGAGNDLTFRGGGDVIAGTLGGAGTISFVGVVDTFNGANLAAADLQIKDSTVTLNGAITETRVLTVITSTLTVGAGGATLRGGGTIAFGDFASNRIIGASAGDTLTNVDTTISGAGMLGAGQMTLINMAGGVIDGNGSRALIIDTGASSITNSGLIEASGAGGVTIQGEIRNSGLLEAAGGVLTVNGAVSGEGSGIIAGGALAFNGAFHQDVAFSGVSGVLQLADSLHYTGTVSGFSKVGATTLDLRDIGFVDSSEASFSGTGSGGVLSISDGVHTAKIALAGDYLTANFVAASDGQGGVTIIATTGGASAPRRARRRPPRRRLTPSSPPWPASPPPPPASPIWAPTATPGGRPRCRPRGWRWRDGRYLGAPLDTPTHRGSEQARPAVMTG